MLLVLKLQVSRPEVVSNLTPDEAEEAKKVKVGAFLGAGIPVLSEGVGRHTGDLLLWKAGFRTPQLKRRKAQVRCWCYTATCYRAKPLRSCSLQVRAAFVIQWQINDCKHPENWKSLPGEHQHDASFTPWQSMLLHTKLPVTGGKHAFVTCMCAFRHVVSHSLHPSFSLYPSPCLSFFCYKRTNKQTNKQTNTHTHTCTCAETRMSVQACKLLDTGCACTTMCGSSWFLQTLEKKYLLNLRHVLVIATASHVRV